MKRIIALTVLTLAGIVLVGCPQQNTIAALTSTLGNAAAGVAALQGNTTLSAALKTDTAAAVSAITNWKQGTPAQNVVQALNLVVDDLNLICPPTNATCGQYAPLIILAISTAQSIIEIVAPGQALKSAKVNTDYSPRNAKEFKTYWNGVVSANPAMAGAEIK